MNAISQVDERFSEDCLTLNIWTKPQMGEGKKAVLVWIPGGGYIAGSSSAATYNGAKFVDQEDVVMVSIK
jgi:carboxylesterase type B